MMSKNYWRNAAGSVFTGPVQPDGEDWVAITQEEFDAAIAGDPVLFVTFGALLSRLTLAERTRLREDRPFDSTLSDAMFLMQYRSRLNIHGPIVEAFLKLLVKEKIIKSTRPAQILAMPITPDELAC